MTVAQPARRLPSLRQNLAYSVAGNTIFALGSWAGLAFLARLTDAATVGQYILALAVTAPLFLLSNLQLREVQATDPGDTPFGSYLSARIATSILAFLMAVGFAFAYDGATRVVVLLTAAAKGLDAVIDMFYGAWLRQERQRLVANSLAVRGITSALVMGVALVLTRSLVVASVASLLQSALNVAYVRSLYRREFDLRLERLARADWLRLGTLIPLGLAIAFDSLAVNVPRYVLEAHFGIAMVGIFGGIGTFMQLGGSTVAVGLAQVGIPRLSKHYAAGDATGYRNLVLKLLGVGIALGLAGIAVSVVAGRELLLIALGREYAEHVSVLRWTMLNALVWYVGGILACGVTATRNFKAQFPIFGVSLAAVALTSFAIVPRYGLEGAAACVLSGFVVRTLANGFLVHRAIKTL